ncbi:GPW/gp25 family protein [Acinetobacter baumannii]|uniref:GPW/gp25 family protein n=1 Tax=Acinetobacter baumannii TaxID=470 RepID=UPI001896B5B5|nr:GPW/gp25 family protein [Acinetobacter baumannii]MBF6812000.1 baseplate assembly protein [Acinetobacter baumannii]MBF6912460.1 GPW/gp25 family protein [Acinetobacter baumannii]MBF6972666.1 GPW/gp25 family protein [Acinetobacter baumannii]
MISRQTGVTISEIESIEQSIEDIVTTPLGSRVMRGDYGSIVPDLIDQPMNDVLVLKIYSAIYTPVTRWEKRISIENINISKIASGLMQLDLETVHTITGQSLNLNIPLQMGASS